MKAEKIVRPKSQREAVIAQLQRKGKINSHEAFEHFGITRLAVYISALKAKGFKIESVKKAGKTKYGYPCQTVEYKTNDKNLRRNN
jgi:biotin operon repressor